MSELIKKTTINLDRYFSKVPVKAQKILKITKYQTNTNENHSEIPPYTNKNDIKKTKDKLLSKSWIKVNLCTLLVEKQHRRSSKNLN
jgi:hypothetical protein